MHHRHVPVRVCTISILWNFHTNPYHPSKNYELKQQGDGAGETSRHDKLRVAGHGPGNTRARCTNTAKRAPNMPTHRHQYRFARFPSCGIFTPTRTSPVKQQLEPQVTAPVKHLKNENYELHGMGWATRAPVAQTLQSVRQTCPGPTATCPYRFARVLTAGHIPIMVHGTYILQTYIHSTLK